MLSFTRIADSTILAQSDRPMFWKCNGLIVDTGNSAVLIDCNFDNQEMRELVEYVNKPVKSYLVTHMHVDHVNNLHIIEGMNIPIYAPAPDDHYLRDINHIMEYSGAREMGVDDLMKKFAFDVQGFKEVKSIAPFEPGFIFNYDSVSIETIALPGHSPGHTGFIVHDKKNSGVDVLFAADVGLDSFGAWYGFKHCSLTDYKSSLEKIKTLYSSGNYILTASHNDPVFEKNTELFEKIITRINKIEKRLIEKIQFNNPVRLKDIVLKGIFYKESSISKMDEFLKKLYYFWEYFSLQNHLRDLRLRGLAEEVSEGTWVLMKEKAYKTCKEVSAGSNSFL